MLCLRSVMNFFSDKEHPLVISSDNESSDSDKANEKSSKELDVDLVISPRGIKTEAVELSANERLRIFGLRTPHSALRTPHSAFSEQPLKG
ncbi:hypothetical protein ACROYT_G041942 [Oculina patagonica]